MEKNQEFVDNIARYRGYSEPSIPRHKRLLIIDENKCPLFTTEKITEREMFTADVVLMLLDGGFGVIKDRLGVFTGNVRPGERFLKLDELQSYSKNTRIMNRAIQELVIKKSSSPDGRILDL